MNHEQFKAATSRMLLAAGVFGLAVGGLVPVLSCTGAVWAQEDDGHEEGGHEEGGGEGKGGQNGGGEGKGRRDTTPQTSAAYTASVDDRDTTASKPLAAPGVDGYVRLEVGAASPDANDANWLPPGASDPRVFFDLDTDTAATGAIAIGRSFGNGWRGEAAFNIFGSSDFSGEWSYTTPADPGPHASMRGSIRSFALFANGYYDFEMEGGFTPFLTAGLGVARNSMDDWTRINPDAGRPTRSFSGGSDSGFAWNVGAGVAWDVGSIGGSGPAKLELGWRYFDLGSVSGSATPIDGNGSSSPREPLNFDVTDQVFSVGLRFPL
jgi:opacity protein-like surface antigen